MQTLSNTVTQHLNNYNTGCQGNEEADKCRSLQAVLEWILQQEGREQDPSQRSEVRRARYAPGLHCSVSATCNAVFKVLISR